MNLAAQFRKQNPPSVPLGTIVALTKDGQGIKIEIRLNATQGDQALQ